jgi:hypothetical protein
MKATPIRSLAPRTPPEPVFVFAAASENAAAPLAEDFRKPRRLTDEDDDDDGSFMGFLRLSACLACLPKDLKRVQRNNFSDRAPVEEDGTFEEERFSTILGPEEISQGGPEEKEESEKPRSGSMELSLLSSSLCRVFSSCSSLSSL